MTMITYTQFTRLSDSLERDLMREALSCGETISLTSLAKSIWAGLKNVVHAVANELVHMTEVLNEARAKDPRFSRSFL